MAQPHHNQGSIDKDFLDYVPKEDIEQPDNSFYSLSILIADTEASMRISAVLHMCESATARGRQRIPYGNGNSNCKAITSITNMTSIENRALVDGGTIV